MVVEVERATPRRELTDKQRQILEYIIEMVRTRGYPPTIRQIGTRFKISSTNGVRTHLSALERKGYIRRAPWSARGIELVREMIPEAAEPDVVQIPVLGKVAAGQPILAQEHLAGYLYLDRSLARDRNMFALKVQGDSMIEAGILEGDYVLVRPQPTAENGDIVVALIGDEATVKQFFREPDGVRLQPANSAMAPIRVRGDVQIIGKVTGLFRTKIRRGAEA
ncbi:MAG TPA: transcriptional repressor LexA [Thermodesulfobacteriota bacterium]|nr:transcriptional repressor LexA [Thermodesulfobacteriota bacterium]